MGQCIRGNKLKCDIVKASKAIRKKYRQLKLGRADEDELFKRVYKPITKPIQELTASIKAETAAIKSPLEALDSTIKSESRSIRTPLRSLSSAIKTLRDPSSRLIVLSKVKVGLLELHYGL
ncbi:hypothetical protein QE152_g9409 [Popillia japonica]|uniref:Uncharacterized protein n=1 Tax=Popillia japonica TaxID=7064 RepID=A0AAW1LUT5_POPJA